MTRTVSDRSTTIADAAAPRQKTVGNRFGQFSEDGREFVITDWRTPKPWSNIIANPRMGLAVSQTGGGFSWVDNSQLAVITRWQQDLVSDSSGKFIYVRDVDRGLVWSLSPAPVFAAYDRYACRHGLGYTIFETRVADIEARWTLLCHAVDTVELWRVELINHGDQTRRLELCGFLEWCCGVAPSPRREFHKLFIETEFDRDRRAVLARNHMWEAPSEKHGHWNRDFPYVSIFSCSEPVLSAQGDKAEFVGAYGSLASPIALSRETWRPRFGRYEDAIAALRCAVELRAGQTQRVSFALAVGSDQTEAADLCKKHNAPKAVESALAEVQGVWRDRLADHRVETPDDSVNFLTNDWLRYQAISGRMWGRCGYYQQSGALGYRDQLQDSQVWLTIDPARCRSQIGLHAGHQFTNGSVYHWWHPLTDQGLVTRMSDDLLWLAFVTASYIRESGDLSVLDDTAPFIDDLAPAPIRRHIEAAFQRVFSRMSPRGLPYIGAGDWNDGLSAAGLQERGESIWLGHFLAGILQDWATIRLREGAESDAQMILARRAELVESINAHGWDGDWYIRATLDDGSPMGGSANRVGKIFLNAQTWAILNEVADPARAATCWSAVKTHLIKNVGALLLTPAFDTPIPEVGYITRYAPGLRENGGVYTHAATWAIAAAAKMNDRETVGALLSAINPANKNPDVYMAEPYVTPGNVDGPESPYFGRGGWTWYTGSAAWLHRVICEWVLGVRPTWQGLLIDPKLPPDWNTAKMRRSYRGCVYDIHIDHDGTLATDSVEVSLDGHPVGSLTLPLPTRVGTSHEVHVRFA